MVWNGFNIIFVVSHYKYYIFFRRSVNCLNDYSFEFIFLCYVIIYFILFCFICLPHWLCMHIPMLKISICWQVWLGILGFIVRNVCRIVIFYSWVRKLSFQSMVHFPSIMFRICVDWLFFFILYLDFIFDFIVYLFLVLSLYPKGMYIYYIKLLWNSNDIVVYFTILFIYFF